MPKNNGKKFESEFKESLPSHVWNYRLPDTGGGMMARFTSKSLCDIILFNTKTGYQRLVELKSTVGTSMSFKTYEDCTTYENNKKEFDEWFGSLPAVDRKALKEEIKEKRKAIKSEEKSLNTGAMIKYHQIKTLIDNSKYDRVDGYFVMTFIASERTYVVHIDAFEHLWKTSTKKSFNTKDLDELIELGLPISTVEQSFIGRSKRVKYELDEIF